MNKWLSPLLLIAIVSAACASPRPIDPVTRITEECAIYTVVIESNRHGFQSYNHNIVIDQTVSYKIDDPNNYLKNNLAPVSADTLQDYQSINAEPSQLKNQCTPSPWYMLAPKNSIDEMFKGDYTSGWKNFSNMYPDSSGMIYLSRVGLNSDLDQALVYMSFSCGSTCGNGDLYILIKDDGVWRIQKVIMLTIS